MADTSSDTGDDHCGHTGRVEDSWLRRDRFLHAAFLRTRLHRALIAVRSRWWVLCLSLLLLGLPAALWAARRPPVFRSQATMWLAARLNLPGGKIYSEELNSYVGTQCELIRTGPIQQRALEVVRDRFPGLVPARAPRPEPVRPFTLRVQNTLRGSVLQLQATGPTAEATRAFLDAVMAEYQSFKRQARDEASGGALARLTNQIKDLEQQLEQEQTWLTLFQASNNLSCLNEDSLNAGPHRTRLLERLSDLRTEHRLLEIDLERPAPGGEWSVPAGVPETAPSSLGPLGLWTQSAAPARAFYLQALQQVELLKGKRAQFASVLRPAHSKMVKLEQDITNSERLLATLEAEEGRRAANLLAQRKEALELQINNLQIQSRDWEANARLASSKLAEYEATRQRCQRLQAFYERLVGLLQTVDVNKNLDQEPLVPVSAASPGRPTHLNAEIAGAGLFLALLVGVGLALVLDLFDDRFLLAAEAGVHLRTKVVGQIPEDIGLNRAPGLFSSLGPENGEHVNESFRTLRGSLWLNGDRAHHPHILLVTSPVPGEGKSTVALHLARSLAEARSPVLFLDADFRRGLQRPPLPPAGGRGLADVLAGQASLEEVIKPIEPSHLFGLPAGQFDSNTSEHFANGAAIRLLTELRNRYSSIVIDTGPVFDSEDTLSLAAACDGVLLVLRDRFTSAAAAREALERLLSRQAKILGLVYNRAARVGALSNGFRAVRPPWIGRVAARVSGA